MSARDKIIMEHHIPGLLPYRRMNFGRALKMLKNAQRGDVVAIDSLKPTDLRDFMPAMQDGSEIGLFTRIGSPHWFAVKGDKERVAFPSIPLLKTIHLHPSNIDCAFFLPSRTDLDFTSDAFDVVISPTGIARYRQTGPGRIGRGMTIENERIRYVFRLSYWDIVRNYMVTRADRLVGPQKPARLMFNYIVCYLERGFLIEYLPWELFGLSPAARDFMILFDPGTSWVP